MRVLATLCLLLAVPALSPAQTSSTDAQIHTYGMLNGRAWKIMPTEVKLWYLIGISEGMIRGNSAEWSGNFQPSGLSTGEVRDAVDHFFAEPDNLLINVIDALHIISMRVKGEPQAAIDLQLSVLRTVAVGAPERKQ